MPAPLTRIQTDDVTLNRIQDQVIAAIQQFVNPLVWITVGSPGAPPFQNGWKAYGQGWMAPGFSRDIFGIVRLRGLLTGGATNVAPAAITPFILPPGYRPKTNFLCAGMGTGTGQNMVIRINVGLDGLIWSASGIPGSTQDNSYWSLDGVQFLAEN